MRVIAGQPFESSLIAPAGDLTNLGARVEVPFTRAIASYWRPAVLSGSVWTVSLDAPVSSGDYNLVWRNGDVEPVSFESFIPLFVDAATLTAVASVPVVDRAQVTPTVEEVANLEQSRAVAEGAEQLVTFTADTTPSASAVEALVQQAVPLVLAELPNKIPIEFYDSVRNAVALYVAVLLEGSIAREQLDEGSGGLWRTLYNTAILNLQRGIEAQLSNIRSKPLQTGGRVLV